MEQEWLHRDDAALVDGEYAIRRIVATYFFDTRCDDTAGFLKCLLPFGFFRLFDLDWRYDWGEIGIVIWASVVDESLNW